jgi:hypothetical protein
LDDLKIWKFENLKMKRIAYILLCALLAGAAVSVQVQAQAQLQAQETPHGRTANTIVADVLAQMPTADAARFDEQMAALASTGEAGVLQLVGMMTPPAEGAHNARIEYALSGLSHWVSAPGREAQRLVVSNAYLKALAAASDREVKAFIIRELQLIGGQEAIAPLEALLADAALKGPAGEALAAITGNALPRVAVGQDELAPEAARTAALAAKIAAKPAKAAKLLAKALKDPDRRYRFAALGMASPYADGAMYGSLVRSLSKAAPEVKADILNWLSQECDIPGRRETIAPLAGPAAAGLLSTGDADLTQAAARLLTKTGGAQAIAALAALLGSPDAQVVATAAKALASTGGDIASAVAPLVPTLGDAGKVAALKLLAARKSQANAATVIAQLAAASPEVRATALAALAEVAPADEIFRLHEAAPADGRHLDYPVLAATGDAKALDIIVDGFNRETGPAKEAAFTALTGMDGKLSVNELLAIAKNPAEAQYFDRALARYTAIISDPAIPYAIRDARLTDALAIARTGAQKSAILAGFRASGEQQSDPAGTQYESMTKAGEYLDDKATQQAAAGAVMRIALGNPQFTDANTRSLLEKVISVLDNPDAGYEQQAIRKHLAEMALIEPWELPAGERAEGFTVLFDGRDLDAWTGNKTDYRVEGGTISLYPSRGFGGNLYTAREYGNFVFRFEFMLTPGANNGVGIRAEQGKDAAYHGMEIQILDHDNPAYAAITPLQVHGSVYGVIGAKRAVLKPSGEWNVEEIVADGDRIRVTLNGEVILDGNIRTAAKNGTADGRQHPGLFNKQGYIGFLGHGSPLKFRNIRIKELP